MLNRFSLALKFIIKPCMLVTNGYNAGEFKIIKCLFILRFN